MDYYQPTSIFRQNAIKRTTTTSPTSSRRSSVESWLYKPTQPELLTKCSNKFQITSNYWKIPDDQLYLTSISINPENTDQLAIASGKSTNNLFIYDFKPTDRSLTHHQTITLPYIQSLQWLNYDTEESMLLSGHKNGYINLVSIPDVSSIEPAQVVKRFNHKKHITYQKNISVKQIMRCNWYHSQDNIVSLCNESVFLWDLKHRSDIPILKNQHLGIEQFDSSPHKNGILALSGTFGISLIDLRDNSYRVPCDESGMIGANIVKWAPYDSNVVAASHSDGMIRLWDLRAQSYFGTLKGHEDQVTSIEWSEQSSSDLYTGDKNGNIVHWDLNFSEDLSDCCLNNGLDSINFHDDKFLVNDQDIYEKVHKRQCGNVIPCAKNPVVQMISVDDKIYSIDGSSYFGVHDKTESFKVEEGVADIMMDELIKEFDDAKTLVGSPMKTKNETPMKLKNDSVNTLSDDVHMKDDVQHNIKDDIQDAFTYEKIQPLITHQSLII